MRHSTCVALVVAGTLAFAVALPAVIMWSLSRLAWAKVAQAYPAAATPPKPATTMGYGVFNGWIGYKGCLILAADDAGLHARNWPLLSWFHPPFFVPWSEIATIQARRIFYGSYVELVFRKTPGITFSLRDGTYEKLRPAFAKAGLEASERR